MAGAAAGNGWERRLAAAPCVFRQESYPLLGPTTSTVTRGPFQIRNRDTPHQLELINQKMYKAMCSERAASCRTLGRKNRKHSFTHRNPLERNGMDMLSIE